MPWNSIVFDSDGKIRDARVLSLSFVFPRIGADLLGNREHAEHAAPGPAIREAMKLVMYANVGLPVGGGWDPENRNEIKYLSRQEYEDELLAPSTSLKHLTYYSDLHEGSTTGVIADKVYAESGPASGLDFWTTHNVGLSRSGNPIAEGSDLSPFGPYPSTGIDVSDWWARTGNGHKKSTFSSGSNVPFNRNITHFTQTDSEGRRYPQFYADYQLAGKFYTSTKKDGTEKSVGSYGDVVDYRTKTSTIDWMGLGSAQDAQDDWDLEGSLGQEAAAAWRAGQWAYPERLQEANPGMIQVANMTTLARQTSTTDMSVFPFIYDEYHLKFNGGHVQNLTKENGASSPPKSGVYSDNALSGGGGDWQEAYNSIVQTVLTTKLPNLCNADWLVDLNDDFNPTESGSQLNIARLGLATVLMHNGIFVLNMNGENYRRVALIDETGLINTSTTGLSQFYLGRRVGEPQLTPTQGLNIWIAEFEFGWAVLNSNLPGGSSTVINISVFGGSGAVRYIDGFQAPSVNTGATITSNFSLDDFDGRILLKV